MSQSCVVRVRRHAITQAVTGLDGGRRRAVQVAGREGLAGLAVQSWCVVWARVVALTWSSCLAPGREEYGAAESENTTLSVFVWKILKRL